MKRMHFLLFLFAAVSLASGCATATFIKAYPGTERPADQLATVIVPTCVEVRSVNGAKVSCATSLLLVKQYKVTTLPGLQSWSVRYSNPMAGGYYADPARVVTESPWTELSFHAEAGQVYRLQVAAPNEDYAVHHEKTNVRFSVVAENALDSSALVTARSPAVSAPPPTIAAPQPAPKIETPQTLESAALGQLKKWWGVAGPEEQRAFREWLQSQP